MSRIAFIQCIYDTFEGTMCLASVLERQGHEVELLIEPSVGKVVEHLRRHPPDIAAFSSITGQHRWVLKVCRELKRRGFRGRTVAGGPHPTFFPRMVEEEGVDLVCRGEGERAIAELAAAVDRAGSLERVSNISYLREGEPVHNPLADLVAELDSLPFPDRDLYYSRYSLLGKSPVKHFLSSRGCPYDCGFCFNKQYKALYRGKGPYLRRKSPGYFLEEIGVTLARHGARFIRFEDDNFIADRGWVEQFLNRYRERVGLPFSCYIRIDNLTGDLALLLKESGCHLLIFSVETGNQAVRNELLNKRLSDDDIVRGAEICRGHGLPFAVGNMVGLPGETLDDAWETVRFNRRLKPLFSVCSIFQPYPSTEIGQRLLESGMTGRQELGSISLLYHQGSVMRQEDIARIVNLHKFFDIAVKHPYLEELVELLIGLPANRFFALVHALSYFAWYKGHSRNSLLFTLKYFATLRIALREISTVEQGLSEK